MVIVLMITLGILMLSLCHSIKDTAIYSYKKCKPYIETYIKEIKDEERKVIFSEDKETDPPTGMFL